MITRFSVLASNHNGQASLETAAPLATAQTATLTTAQTTAQTTADRYRAGVMSYRNMGYWQPDYQPKRQHSPHLESQLLSILRLEPSGPPA